ncbi:hypothetical protein M1615_02435 [Patescibacteria group bacterium]|nr:hypothetical protein [Patescibacteria group bacterium]
MAKRKRTTRSKSKGIGYKPETYGIKFDSLTFLLFLVFVVVVAMLLVSQVLGY